MKTLRRKTTRLGKVLLCRLLILCTVILTATACIGTRPRSACVVPPTVPGVTNNRTFQVSVADSVGGLITAPGPPRRRLDVLVLSGGGSWGAYGAGFINGWTKRAANAGIPRPQFDIVTGISTGAIIAPFALLGPQWDGILEGAYNGISSVDVLATRSILVLFSWNSLKDVEPLQSRLNADLDAATLTALARAAQEHRSVWVGATNADTGTFTRFDLTGIALYQPQAEARKEIVDRILAATAIPVFFPPRFIDGCMYVDGGVRENLFLAEIGDAIHSALGGVRELDNATINIYAVLNGPLSVSSRITENTLLDVGERGFELAANQIQLASLRETYDFAALNHYNFYWTSPDDLVSAVKEPGKCGPPPEAADQFSSDFTACLFEAGRKKAATAAAPWRNDRP